MISFGKNEETIVCLKNQISQHIICIENQSKNEEEVLIFDNWVRVLKYVNSKITGLIYNTDYNSLFLPSDDSIELCFQEKNENYIFLNSTIRVDENFTISVGLHNHGIQFSSDFSIYHMYEKNNIAEIQLSCMNMEIKGRACIRYENFGFQIFFSEDTNHCLIYKGEMNDKLLSNGEGCEEYWTHDNKNYVMKRQGNFVNNHLQGIAKTFHYKNGILVDVDENEWCRGEMML